MALLHGVAQLADLAAARAASPPSFSPTSSPTSSPNSSSNAASSAAWSRLGLDAVRLLARRLPDQVHLVARMQQLEGVSGAGPGAMAHAATAMGSSACSLDGAVQVRRGELFGDVRCSRDQSCRVPSARTIAAWYREHVLPYFQMARAGLTVLLTVDAASQLGSVSWGALPTNTPPPDGDWARHAAQLAAARAARRSALRAAAAGHAEVAQELLRMLRRPLEVRGGIDRQ